MKCPHCGKLPHPVREEDEFGNVKWNWKNLFRVNLSTIVAVALILFLAYGYNNDTEQCFNILEEPCDFIDQYQCNGTLTVQGGVSFMEQVTIDGINITTT